jgi:Fe-S cluster biogenesis protein NfuA
MNNQIDVLVEPLDDERCNFILSRAVTEEPGIHRYASSAEAADSPVARTVLAIAGVTEVVVSGNVLTVSKKDPRQPWSAFEPRVRYAVETAMAEPVAVAAPQAVADDDAMFDVVDEILRTQINPSVAQHGGKVELIDVEDATVIVRMMGGCQGCGMADVTLRQGIEASLRRVLPSLKGIKDITDHASGSNPYFSAGSK